MDPRTTSLEEVNYFRQSHLLRGILLQGKMEKKKKKTIRIITDNHVQESQKDSLTTYNVT